MFWLNNKLRRNGKGLFVYIKHLKIPTSLIWYPRKRDYKLKYIEFHKTSLICSPLHFLEDHIPMILMFPFLIPWCPREVLDFALNIKYLYFLFLFFFLYIINFEICAALLFSTIGSEVFSLLFLWKYVFQLNFKIHIWTHLSFALFVLLN